MKMNGKAVSVIGGSALLLVLLLLLHLMQGQVDISVSDMVHSLLYAQGSSVDQAIWGLRLPRAVAGILCGAALATSGVLLQTVLRNPLASASTLGINAGAYLAVVAGTVWSPFLLHQFSFVFALAGGILAAGMAYVLAGGHRAPPIRLVLSGLIVTLLLSSLTSMMQILYLEDASHLFVWGSGSLMQNNWHGLQLTWHWMAIGLTIVFLSGKSLDLLTLGEESATSLGQRMVWTKVAMSGIAITLAALSVSLAGPIGYIGLLAPHIIRLTGIRQHRLLIPASAMLGAGLLLVADLLTSMFQATYGTLPVGAVTALLGGGWLVVFVLRTHKKRQGIGGFGGMPSSSVSSFRANKRRMFTAYLLLGLALFGVTLYGCLHSGHSMLTMEQLIQTLLGHGEPSHHYLVWQLRLPRMAAAWLGGAALAVAGLLIQSAVRNPMADPSVMGVTSGAGAGVLALLVIWPYAPGWLMGLCAFAGAVMISIIIFAAAWRSGLEPGTLLLAGISISAVSTAVIQILVLRTTSFTAALIWLAGSTYARGWTDTLPLVIVFVLVVPIAWWLGKRVELLSFTDEVATGVGQRIKWDRLLTASLGLSLAAIVVATVGTVGFIGLLAPHAARLFTGTAHRRTMGLSMLIGALLLATADVVGRLVAVPKEVPSGLMVSLIGAPYLLYLLYRNGRRVGSL
ncbi:iron ABC transporter permease [Paenibacillus massiliensis]|uniref:iron ABC transporter permease n=2 Tax=Paenibacillus massiliensis TaxID=225917 RepID=UPI00036FAE97|nr:iron ABC transporter permease [Paenibacillus massiliensis]